MMKVSSLFWTIFTVMCCSLNQVGESKNNCGEDEYYESAIQQCRSCSIPCKMSKALCQEMCPGFQAITTVQSITEVDESKNNCGEDEYYEIAFQQCRPCSTFCRQSGTATCREMCPDYQKSTTLKLTEVSEPTGWSKLSDLEQRTIIGVISGTIGAVLSIFSTMAATYLISCIKKRSVKAKKCHTIAKPQRTRAAKTTAGTQETPSPTVGTPTGNQQSRPGSSKTRQGSVRVHKTGNAQGAGIFPNVSCTYMTVNQTIIQAPETPAPPTEGPSKEDEDPSARDSFSTDLQ